jgi:DNA processing protein
MAAVYVTNIVINSGADFIQSFSLEGAESGSPFDLRCKGTNRLIKEGATIFENVEDFLISFPHLKMSFTQVNREEKPADISNQYSEISNGDIKKIREEILQKLNHVPIDIEDIIHDLQISPKLVNVALVELEMENKIEMNFGRAAILPS